MDPTATMYEAARRYFDEQSISPHGYTGVAVGLAAVLKGHGLSTDMRELTHVFHDPLSDFHSAFEQQQVTFADVVRAFSHPPRGGGGAHQLPYPFDKIKSGSFPYLGRYSPNSIRIDVTWMAREAEEALRKAKIRRGTKRYQEWVKSNAPKVVSAAEKAATAAKEQAQRDYVEAFAALDKYHDQAVENKTRLERRIVIRKAILNAGGVGLDFPVVKHEREALADWDRVIKGIEKHAVYLESGLSEFDVKEAARAALKADQKLRPFLDVAA